LIDAPALEPHPIANLFPLMTEPELAALAEGILANKGLQVPILLFEGKILDGRNRYIACTKAGVTPRTEVFNGSWTEAMRMVWSLNIRRRHLTSTQIGAIEAKAYPERPEYRQAVEDAKAEAKERQRKGGGDKKSTTAKGKKSVPQTSGEPINPHAKETASFRAKVSGTNRTSITDVEKVMQEAPEEVEELIAGTKTLPQVKKELKTEARKDNARKAAAAWEDTEQFRWGDFAEVAKKNPDNSVQLIFTDPPYDTDHVCDYGRLAEVAARVLVDGGSLIAYCGHRLFPKIFDAMRHVDALSYYGILACIHTGELARMLRSGLIVTWKPMLWWIKGKERMDTSVMLELSVDSEPAESPCHHWQQGLPEAMYYVEKLTEPGGLVFDPFCGGGTTAVACKNLGRKIITCDIDAAALASAQERFLQA
jgi:hypothetical protein